MIRTGVHLTKEAITEPVFYLYGLKAIRQTFEEDGCHPAKRWCSYVPDTGVLAKIPDGELLHALRTARGEERNNYPVEVLWETFLLLIILRHVTMEACPAELRRNEDLRRVIGITSEARVPHSRSMSRFENLLGEEPFRTMVKKIFDEMIKHLGEAVPDLGQDTAWDGRR